MSFEAHGFLSPAMDRLRTDLRAIPSYGPWFQFAEDLNRLGLGMLQGLEVPSDDNQRLIVAALFIRAHKSFQAAIILTERGLLGDARVIVRSAVEGAIALNALANDAAFVQQLIDAHYHWQRKTARLVLRNADYRPMYSTKEVAEMEATINDIDMRETAGAAIREINWDQVALKHCKDLYELLYRLMSSDGTHTNLNTIQRAVVYDTAKHLKGFKVGPDIDGMIETLKAACLTFLWAAEPFDRVFERQNAKEMQDRLRRFEQLPQDEPKDATVVNDFHA